MIIKRIATEKETEDINKLYDSGLKITDIVKELKLPKWLVSINVFNPRPQGQPAKVTVAMAIEINAMRKNKKKGREIAEKLGISLTTINRYAWEMKDHRNKREV